MATDPNLRETLSGIAKRLDAAGKGESGKIVDESCQFLGWSRNKLYSRLKADVGWSSGRKTRSDKGSTCVPTESLEMLATAERESLRATKKQILKTPTGASILEVNGYELPVSNSQLNRLMRARKLNVAAQAKTDAPQTLRSLYPNHVHQVDPSLCVLYYMHGKQAMMDADRFYKNKLENYAKIKLKVWRYVLYDHASGLIAFRYFETRGENAMVLFEFLDWAWRKQEGREFHGVPKIMMWDKGSANTSASIKNLLGALEVDPIEHAAGKARVKGGVENANNLVECNFESRLKFEPVHSVEELNEAALHWQNAFNANLIPRQDTRLRRPGAAPTARYDFWRLIKAEHLRVLPDVDLRPYLEGREDIRTVKGLAFTFRHPAAKRTMVYKVGGLDAINDGDDIAVRPLLYGTFAISIRVQRYDGEDLLYSLEPQMDYDEFGRPSDAPVIGEEFKGIRQTDADRAGKRMDELAYPGEDATKQRQKQAAPFGGKLDAHSHLADINLPIGLPRRGSDLTIPDRLQIEVKPLNHVQMASELARLVDGWSVEMYQQMTRLYPEGCQESELQQVADRLTKAPRLGLVAVGGN